MKFKVLAVTLLLFVTVCISGCDSGDGSGSGDFTLGGPSQPTTIPTASGTPSVTPSPTPTEPPCEEIVWAENWDKVIESSLENNKMVMIYFYTDVCPSCRKLERGALADGEVNSFLCQNFLTVKSNSNKSSLSTYFDGIRYVPTVVFMTPDGFEIGDSRMVGAKSSSAFLERITRLQDFWIEHLETTGVI